MVLLAVSESRHSSDAPFLFSVGHLKKKKCDWMTDNPHTVDAKNHYFIVDIVFNDLGSNAIHLT